MTPIKAKAAAAFLITGRMQVESNSTLRSAILAVLSMQAAAGYAAAAETGDSDSSSDGIAAIVVTAQRRVENIQNVPITIQVLNADTLKNLNVETFDDFVKYVPNVTSNGSGPGQSQIYMRGLATTAIGLQSSGSTGSFPNVAVYLDDQSVQMPGRNLDIYTADLERIEVLEGPQGTLFGAGAQAGVIRYITNKPKLNVTEAAVNAGYATTAHGSPSTNVDAMLNLPLIADTLAIRAVVYDDTRGGYINNIPGTFSHQPTDQGIVQYFGGVVPPGSESINNNSIAGNAINPVVYQGLRVSGLYDINPDWNALITQSYQQMRADGVFAQMPTGSSGQALPPLSVQLFNPSYNKDKFSNTAWTLTGRLDQLKLVYTGGYLTRNIEQNQDYTNYSRGPLGAYYQCRLEGTNGANDPGQCFSPSSYWHDVQRNTHQSHEIRLSTPDDWRLRAIGGVFWERFQIQDTNDWYAEAPGAGYNVPLQPPPGIVGVNNPNPRFLNDDFYDDITRGYTQKAAFASIDYDLIPKRLTITAGTRWYSMNTYETGADGFGYGCRLSPTPANPTCTNTTTNLNTVVNSDGTVGLHKTYSGFRSRFNLSWKVTDDALIYYTWSQGFRPGGFNRGQGVVPASSPLAGLWSVPYSYAPDTLTNQEIGWKTEWLDHRLQFNGAVYREDWKNVQINVFNPNLFGNLVFGANGPEYRVKGIESELIFRLIKQLTVTAAASWNSSELTNSPTLIGINGKPIASNLEPFGAIGSPLAMSPPFQGNIRIRYEFKFNDYDAFWQLAGTHQGHSYSTTDRVTNDLQGNSIAYENAAFSTMDGSIGIGKDHWTAQFYGENLGDTRAQLYSNYLQFTKMTTVNRPRTVGLRFSYKFSDGG